MAQPERVAPTRIIAVRSSPSVPGIVRHGFAHLFFAIPEAVFPSAIKHRRDQALPGPLATAPALTTAALKRVGLPRSTRQGDQLLGLGRKRAVGEHLAAKRLEGFLSLPEQEPGVSRPALATTATTRYRSFHPPHLRQRRRSGHRLRDADHSHNQ